MDADGDDGGEGADDDGRESGQEEEAGGEGGGGDDETGNARRRRGKRTQVTPREYAAHRLQVREVDGEVDDALHRAGRLFQEYCCMALAKQEMQRLRYLETHQKEIRAELYKHLTDAVDAHDHAGDGEPLQAGQRVILPSSFSGGPRNMHGRYQDGMAVVRKRGKPSFFITMTCNPKWREITQALLPGQSAADRPDLLARVFKLKLDMLLEELYKDGIFGKVIAHLHVIEFQKRGLPHAHILIILDQTDRPLSAEAIDAVVRAELPHPPGPHATAEERAQYDALVKLVVEQMTHNDCTCEAHPVCMYDANGNRLDACKGHFPKEFNAETTFDESKIYPQYRRRAPEDGGATYTTAKGRVIDNRWITPYSPYLLLKYQCHLNVEVCVSVESVKYLYKYCYKGPDRAMVAVREATDAPENEIALFQDMRSFGSSEACWRTFNFAMYGRSPTVQRLPIHLENMQRCQYEAGHERQRVAAGAPKTELTAWFDYLADDAHAASRSQTYADFPEQHAFNKTQKVWKVRRPRGARPVGRVYTIHPSAGDVFYLRTLLHNVTGEQLGLASATGEQAATDRYSFDALKYDEAGVKHESFQAACAARGLLRDDLEWRRVLEDACAVECCARKIRMLYVYIIVFNEPKDAAGLLDEFWERMADDLKRGLQRQHVEPDEATLRAMLLSEVDELLQSPPHRTSLAEKHVPFTEQQRARAAEMAHIAARSEEPTEIRDELPADRDALRRDAAKRRASLRPSQQLLVDAVLAAVDAGTPLCAFVDAPGGTGKTFSFNAILSEVRSKGEIALAVASSGIAAILLALGRTFCSRFKPPWIPTEGKLCNISAQTNLAKLLRRAKLILWDEAPMTHRFHLESLDLTLRDLMKTVDPALEHVPFGGKVVVLGGDFRQTLPIVKKGSRAQIVEASHTRSRLWKHFGQNLFRLTDNMRVEHAAKEDGAHRETLQQFAEWLLALGDGRLEQDEEGRVALPPEMCLDEGADMQELIDWVFPDLATRSGDVEYIAERAVLAPLNTMVDRINDAVAASFPGAAWTCLSSDELADRSDLSAPVELLNSFDLPGLPKHKLELKPNMPIMLLRNLDPRAGLCNGTRLIVRRVINGRLLEAQIASAGEHQGDIVYIPRIQLSPEEGAFPWAWSRVQFPVRVGFALTINKAQGQTLKRVGIYLETECFGHGQLYVAASRVGDPAWLRFALDPNDAGEYRTKNVVYAEALTSLMCGECECE